MKHRKEQYRATVRIGGVAAARDLDTQHYLRLLVTIIVSFFTTAILLYPERFQLGTYPFSYLGSRTTPLGFRNVYARLLFDMGVLLCAYTMFLMARYYRRKQPVPDSIVYEFLSYTSTVGFFFMVAPCDVQGMKFLHSMGSGFVVGSHLFMATIRVIAVSHSQKPRLTLILLTTLFSSVLLYAGLWFVKHPSNALLQKPAFAAIIFVELYGSALSRYHGEIKVFNALHSVHHH